MEKLHGPKPPGERSAWQNARSPGTEPGLGFRALGFLGLQGFRGFGGFRVFGALGLQGLRVKGLTV